LHFVLRLLRKLAMTTSEWGLGSSTETACLWISFAELALRAAVASQARNDDKRVGQAYNPAGIALY
jgi:hypothetical protein